MLGMVCWQERGRVTMERVQVASMAVLCARVSRGGRQPVRAAGLLRRAGVRRLLEPAPGQPILPGFAVVDGGPLYRAVAHRLVLESLKRRGIAPERACVCLRGEYPDGDLAAAARALCPHVRQVVVETDRGGAALQRELMKRFGVAVGPLHDRRDVLAVRFSGENRGEELVLCEPMNLNGLWVDVPGLDLPENLSRAGVLCALWQGGGLDPARIWVGCGGRENNALDIHAIG